MRISCCAVRANALRPARRTVTSHINEGPATYHEDSPLPPPMDGDIVAILGGGCCQANWHEHCLRTSPEVLSLEDRLPV